MKQIGSAGDDISSGITFDKTGNLFITGYFSGSVDFDPGSGTNILATSSSFSDVFVLKMDTNGNHIWAKKIGGEAGDGVFAISLDNDDNILLSGNFWETADFDPGPGLQNLTALSNADNFILKLTHDGDFIWVKQIGGPLVAIQPFSLKTDKNNNVISAGHFDGGTCDFDPGTTTNNFTSINGYTGYVLKLDANGNFVWVSHFTGNISQVYIKAISVTGNGNIYAAGNFNGTVDFDPGTGVYNLSSTESGMEIKLDSNGNFAWVKNLDQQASCVVSDSEESSFVGEAGTRSLSKIDKDGNVNWKLSFENTVANSFSTIYADNLKNIYVAGWFGGTSDFAPGAETYNLTSVAASDIFIQKLSEETPLPVHFVSLNVKTLQNGNFVEWEIVAELQDRGHFSLEKSTDGIHFSEIGKKELMPSKTRYSILDPSLKSGLQYYRVRSIDADQHSTFSKTVILTRQQQPNNPVTIWPNPVTDILNIISVIPYQKAVLKISDISGRLILKKDNCQGNQFSVNCSFLVGGIYVMEIDDGVTKKVFRVVKR